MQERRSNLSRSQETRGALITAARSLFIEKGYAATGTPEMVKQAGVTRGALYHHFKDKQAVFLAVVEAEAAEVAREIEANSGGASTALESLIQGAAAYFRSMRQPGRVRLLLLEGPAILGAAEMRRIDLETGGEELRRGIKSAFHDEISDAEAHIYADLISAMFDRAALACDEGADAEAYQSAITTTLAQIVQSRRPK